MSDGPGGGAAAGASPEGQQGVFAGMPQPLVQVTPSRLLTWLQCPRRYRLVYLDRPAPRRRAARAHTNVGIAIHNALRDFWDLAPVDRTPAAGARLVDESWVGLGFRDAAQQARVRRRAQEAVVAYLADVDPHAQPRYRERQVAFTSGRMSLWGRLDRLDERDGAPVVVDYKTGRAELTDDDARTSLPLALYAAAVWKMFGRRCTTVELHHVTTGRVLRHEHTPESLTRKVNEARSIVQDLARVEADFAAHGSESTSFEPRPGALCTWCDVRAHCREGQAVGPEQPDWAGLPGEDDRA